MKPIDLDKLNEIRPTGMDEQGDPLLPSLLESGMPGVALLHVGRITARMRAMPPNLIQSDVAALLSLCGRQHAMIVELTNQADDLRRTMRSQGKN